ncbi:hypothetical protein [Streptomyces sp. NBC_01264]|uniref:hypothetical protein n=1 Tax=Streptomyces sp. NBC_01264 TaxID=2903804 RepID=UPI00225BFAFE|nr:hypothetical protein [Streptomyces sp. NBC_01264]MCX4782856.1 hypothetical protein [Streptomyces sp. NBC_01264]
MDHTRNVVNRIVLLAGGCVLLGAATAVVTAGAYAGTLPRGWKGLAAGVHRVTPWTGAGWSGRPTWTAAAAVVLLVALTAMGMLFLQLCRRILRQLPLNSPNCTLDGRAVTSAMTARLRALPGVISARTSLYGSPGKAGLRTRLVVDDTASPGQLLAALNAAVLPEARSVLAPRRLAAHVRVTVRGARRFP